MADFNDVIARLNKDYEFTLKQGTGEGYSRLSTIFEDAGSSLREYIQEITGNDIKRIIQKLKKGDSLNDTEKEEVRLWIVGDAEYYTKLENNYEDWQSEMQRLMGEINAFQGQPLDVVTASKLRGLLRDGSRVLADIFYYVQQRDRIEKFNNSIENMDPASCDLLAGILTQKLNSPDY